MTNAVATKTLDRTIIEADSFLAVREIKFKRVTRSYFASLPFYIEKKFPSPRKKTGSQNGPKATGSTLVDRATLPLALGALGFLLACA